MPAIETSTVPAREVEDWRLQQLRHAGWPDLEALQLALDPTIDLHLACELLINGCLPQTAWQILR